MVAVPDDVVSVLREKLALPSKAALWPVRNVYMMSTVGAPEVVPDVKGHFSGGTLHPWHNKVTDYVGVQFGSLPKIAIAAAAWCWTVDMAAAGKGYDFSLGGWVMRIVARDLALMVLVAGGWDWLLYSSPLRDRMAAYKFNTSPPSTEQLWRDRLWTTSATLLAAVQEILLMRWWAGGFFRHPLFGAKVGETHVPWGEENPFFGNDYTWCYIAWTMTMLYWRIAHFFLIHRGMHPWWSREGGLANGDVGAFLFQYVHAHHHKSYNPTAWSGISMLPVESISYISAALIPLLFRSGCHPFIHLYTKIDLIIGAQIGHDGFDAPGGGSYYHQLHHAHFECNYGDGAVPLDYLFGCFEDGSKWAKDGAIAEEAGAHKADVPKAKAPPVLAGALGAPLLATTGAGTIRMEEVARHNKRDDCWIVLHGNVLNVTHFLSDHPGGEQVLMGQAGKDATNMFDAIHKAAGGYSLVAKHAPTAFIGTLCSADEALKCATAESTKTDDADDARRDMYAQVGLHAVFAVVCVVSWGVIMGDIV